MTRKEYLQEKLARVERDIEAVNSNPNRGFRDDESLCYEAAAIQKEIDELEKQEAQDEN